MKPKFLSQNWDSDTEEPKLATFDETDQLDFYLANKTVPSTVIDDAGGILRYWEQQLETQPQLAQMALDFLSAPGQASLVHCLLLLTSLASSSVDAECAFSSGRLQVNHLQRGMSSQTFKAQVALGSWVGSPIFPSTDPFIAIVEDSMRRARKPKDQGQEHDVNEEDEGEYIPID